MLRLECEDLTIERACCITFEGRSCRFSLLPESFYLA